jgi:hypothetical protein
MLSRVAGGSLSSLSGRTFMAVVDDGKSAVNLRTGLILKK